MIDHSSHAHPSTPAARALCRANGGTGFIGKVGTTVPSVPKSSAGKTAHVPSGPVSTKTTTPKALVTAKTTSMPPAAKVNAPPVRRGTAGGAKAPVIPPTVVPKAATTPRVPQKGNTDFTLLRKGNTNVYGVHLGGKEVGKITKRSHEEFPDIKGTNLRSAKPKTVTKYYVTLDKDKFVEDHDPLFTDKVGSSSLVGAQNDLKDRLKRLTLKPDKAESSGTISRVTPKSFMKDRMEVRDADGNWQKVIAVKVTPGGRGGAGVRKRAAEYHFLNAQGNTIRSASPNEKIEVREAEIPRVNVPPRNLSATMSMYIPDATGRLGYSDEENKIQNALRRGASRDFIVSQSKMPESTTNRTIDTFLRQYSVPNHVYPRQGTAGAKAPVPFTPTVSGRKKSPMEQLKETGRVEAPTGPKSANLKVVEKGITIDDAKMSAKAKRVAAIQERHAGDRIKRIRSVKTGIPKGGAYEGDKLQNANGVCLNGHIHLHKDLELREDREAAARATGWKVRGGDDPIETTIAHEMGHALLTNWDINAPQRQSIAQVMIEALKLKDDNPEQGWTYTKFDQFVQDNGLKIAQGVNSKYAKTNSSEFIAEVWADYTMNPNPSDSIKKIGDAIKNVISQLPARR